MSAVELVLIASSVMVIVSDVCYRRISNKLCLFILLCCLIFGVGNEELSIHFIQGALILTIGLALFGLGIIGAGDIKLLSSYSLIIDSQYWLLSLIVVGFLGGLTAVGVYIKSKIVSQTKNAGIPYGIPIVLSSLFFIHLSTLN